ncbi:unnamed protein product [Adineta steineri]|uniref:Alpha/beta hydrolase fold-3 domain-containing protein n=2 Tax=Adineta steineri TaxID=433720 RepID=A0A819Z5N9_9BILA|nr:unnamed protein product [Adineta steineri]CAF1295114.1 unnamed protein product [Adineta steineri]CAF4158769.1 unnamed protein product [Adineta steineri]
MSFLTGIFGLLKKFVLFILILAIAIPIRYGSTDYRHLSIRLFHSLLSMKYSFIPDQTRPTLSADYRAFEALIRMRPLLNHDSSLDSLDTIKKIRSSFSESAVTPKPSQCEINNEIIDYNGHLVNAYWINYPSKNFEEKSDKLILYFHGGAYFAGNIQVYDGFECHLSKLFNATILHVEYRLCPEHPLPAAVDDSVAVYRALLHRNVLPSQIMIMGDSAGGGLSLLTIQALITNELPIPRGVIVLSPWTDLSGTAESYTRNQHTDVMIRFDNHKWLIEQLLGSNQSELSFDNAIFSPLFGSFEKFPPMYINVGTAEILEDDSKRLLKKAEEANVDVTYEEGLHLMHVYPLFFLYYPEAQHTLDNINKWVQTIYNQKLIE